ncbi:At-hook motif nuclear-localized protein [Thalictrum thalictroides]|uniref:AT-hook motif nuclear-localized protein n=1 Tax=Thalictrum thalictroides TaxID=46969 RepID=A0A7J6VIQ2_THATH|nr:At-hook motif nuclear-localized protein [Thalictrum thalictroides]
MFTNTQNHNHNPHVSSPHYSSSEPPTTTHHVFSPNSVTANRGFLPSSAPQPPPPPPPETVKRKRGRPRKYGTPEVPSSTPSSSSVKQISSPLSSPPRKKDPSSGSSSLNSSSKKSQLVSLGNAGQGFTPHIITVAAGEDVSQKIMSFVQQTKCAVCILSASGSISNASLRQPAMLGGNVTYEGRFEILSLSGSFLHNEIGGTSSRTGGLSVCLSSTDGRIIGGGVGGPLRAAAPVQVIAGSFFYDVTKNAIADKKHEASLDKSPPQVVGASITSVTFRNAPDSSGRMYVRENDDHQSFGGHFMLQPRGMDVTSPHLTDWRGGLDARGGASIDFAGTTDHGECQSPEDGDDE